MDDTCAQLKNALACSGTPDKSWKSIRGRARIWFAKGELCSRAIWGRTALLFAVLCLVKLAVMISLRKYLFEIHWRVGAQPLLTWTNELAFYAFAVLGGLHLWRLGTRCMEAGAPMVRAANVCVLILGGGFILLTFHEGDKNYLVPVMFDVLNWKDMGWYFVLDFFFRKPFLAAWLLGYALVYYHLFRTRREQLILRVTAVCAAAYVALCLTDLAYYFNPLVVTDGIGIACLLCSTTTRRPLSSIWTGLLLFGAGSMLGLCYGLDFGLNLKSLDPSFVVLTGGSLVLLAGVTAFSWRRGFYGGWSWTLPFALAAFLLFANMNYGQAANYMNLLCAGLTLPRYFLGEFIVAGAMLMAAVAYRRWRPTGSMWWLDVVSLFLVALALVDLRLAGIMGIRLDWQALSLALGETPKMIWRMARPYFPAVSVLLLVVAAIYAVFLRTLLNVDGRRGSSNAPQLGSGLKFFLLTFVLLGLAGRWLLARDKAQGESALLLAETSPLWKRAVDRPLAEQKFVETARLLGMNQLVEPEPYVTRARRDLNVVLVFQESVYNQYLSLFNGSEDTEPLLSKYRDRMEIFPNFFSNFAGSIQSRFAAFTGIYPGRNFQEFTARRVEARSLFEVLHDQGYACSMFYSSSLDYTGFRDYLRGRGIDEMYDADTMPGERETAPVSWGLREEETLGAIQAQIKRYAAKNEKFFLTYLPAAPHHPYDGTPARFRKYHREKVNDFTPSYMNELLYMDWVIASIVDQLRDSGVLNKTLVVITDDHGEMLGANGGPVGHGWAVTPELANIPLIIMDPGRPGYHINYTIGSQVDLLPTVLDLLGIPTPADQLYQGTSLYFSSASAGRTIYLNSFCQYAIIAGDRLVCGTDGSGADGRSASNNSKKANAISNQGSRTIFVETAMPKGPQHSISDFNRFQENFLRNYSHYCQLIRGRERVTKRGMEPAPSQGLTR
jgi:phosphoglycerol transferase MdoB-like AlkP superfamily enzyme